MAGMGPAPKSEDQRRRRNASIAMTRLPAKGREGPPPKWPLVDDVRLTAARTVAKDRIKAVLRELDEAEDGRVRARLNRELGTLQQRAALLDAQIRAQRAAERSMWTELWNTPQASAWERLGWTREVATYVRYKVLGELGDLDSAKEARQWSDRLGLTPLAMLRLRWEVAPDELGAKREEKATEAATPAKRTRFKVVDPSAVAG